MLYLLAGPVVAVIGIVAVFFVLRRKSVDKQSMYSARRRQIEHKVKAARQRTLTPHSHAEKAAPTEVAPMQSPFAQTQAQPMVTYDTSAYQAPSSAPPTPPPSESPPQPAWEQPAQPQEMPWETAASAAPAAAPSSFDFPAAPSAEPPTFDYPAAPAEPFAPSPAEPAPQRQPSEPVWTPAPQPAEPAMPIEQPVAAAATATSPGASWSVVSTAKDSAITGEEPGQKRKKGKNDAAGSAWSLASGETPGMDADEPEVKRANTTLVAAAQYAVLVVGLVMVLIGVLVMVANSHVT